MNIKVVTLKNIIAALHLQGQHTFSEKNSHNLNAVLIYFIRHVLARSDFITFLVSGELAVFF